MYIKNHGIPRSIGWDQAKCVVEIKLCNTNNIEIIETPVNEHRATGLEKRLIQTIKNRLACIKEGKSANKSFNIKHAKKIIIHQFRICQQKTKQQRLRPSRRILVENLITC